MDCRLMASVALVAPIILLGACSDDPPPGTSDCARGLLFEDGEYVEAGFVDEAGDEAGTAALARCDDNGTDASGAVFDEDGEAVSVWRLDSVPEANAVGLEVESRYAVMLNQDLNEQERADVLEHLGVED